MNSRSFFSILTLTVLFSGCDLVSPEEVQNPNVDEQAFLDSPEAMEMWVNGTEMQFATTVARFCELTELLSDNYYNNYTRSSKIFDALNFDYRSSEVSTLATKIGELTEMARFGLENVAESDATTTPHQRFTLSMIWAYTNILAGETFVALPLEARGDVVTWQEQLASALSHLDEAEPLATTNDERATLNLLRARIYRVLGESEQAQAAAARSIALAPTLLTTVSFDGANNVKSTIHEYIASAMFLPLPRLDFLNPKYPLASYWEADIAIAKAEEAYLILAEVAAASGDAATASAYLETLLTLVSTRPTQPYIDTTDNRQGDGNSYPNGADYRVAASSADTLRAGLMCTHGTTLAANAYTLATVSGTSVTHEMITRTASQSARQLLQLIYLMRQEIFLAEGRRATDLSIRLPLPETEAALHADLPASYTEPFIPTYISDIRSELDAFVQDPITRTITIKHNLNNLLIINHCSAFD